jgi:hypothetical protein
MSRISIVGYKVAIVLVRALIIIVAIPLEVYLA